jgi:hypothetical protein
MVFSGVVYVTGHDLPKLVDFHLDAAETIPYSVLATWLDALCMLVAWSFSNQ